MKVLFYPMPESFISYFSNQCGVVTLLMSFAVVAIAWLWWLERLDRRAAWKARNEDVNNLLTVLNDQKTILEVVKTILIQGRD